ncbi:MAG: autoinducer 2 ABC transporter substrate-binding protein [Verrucomicrobia bacterium]|nr:autoinducer 2 ABC transporter substrate-binding protein [Verrucomicrobiota bacterium]
MFRKLYAALLLSSCVLLAGCERPAPPPVTRVAMVVKAKGDAYFDACARGGRKAAKELSAQFFYETPVDGSVEEQIEAVDGLVTRRMDAIVIAPHEALALAPALKRARQNGVHVITFDTDADEKRSGREWFVRPASDEAVGRGLVESMVSSAGEKARTMIVASTSAATRQQQWIRDMREYIGKKRPTIQIVDIKRCEDANAAFTATQEALQNNPDITGIFALSPELLVSAAKVVKAGSRKRFVTGVGLPNSARAFVKAGIVPAFVMWNPEDLGHLAVQVAVQTVKGRLREDSAELVITETEVVNGVARTKTVSKAVKNREVLLGEPMIVTAADVDQFDF